MSFEQWLVRGTKLRNGSTTGKYLSGGKNWQLYATSSEGFALAVHAELYNRWKESGLIPDGLFAPHTENEAFLVFTEHHDCLISSVEHGAFPENAEQACGFASALKETRKVLKDVSFADAVYIESLSRLLPTFTDTEHCNDQVVLGRWLSGGVNISTDQFDRLCQLLSWMPPEAVAHIVGKAGLSVPGDVIAAQRGEQLKSEERIQPKTHRHHAPSAGDHFSLPGRPILESFFNDHVVDIVLNSEQYRRMGIEFPSALILHGPPGCGKTYAVDKLVEFLGWPSYSVDSGSIGSPYIHDTSKKIAEVFDEAIKNAPSVVILDEMEAFLTSRDTAHAGIHHMEEVAEFLRRIPEATQNHVLVVAMTNMIDSIDKAILRRGRFDHIIQVDMPSKEEIFVLLQSMLSSLPVADTVALDDIAAQLQGHPISDVTFVVKEAGRQAVKQGSAVISQDLLYEAIHVLPTSTESKRRIGFSADDT